MLMWGGACAKVRLLFVLLIVSLTAPAVSALEFSPFFDFSEIYSSNIEPFTGSKEKEEYVSQISPGFTLEDKGRRVDMSIQYRWQGLYYANDSDKDSSYHQLQSNINVTVLNELLFLEGSQSYQQMITNPQVQGVQSNITLAVDRQDVSTSKISPYVKKRLANFADAELRFSHDEVRYSDESDQNSTGDDYSLHMTSVQGEGPWTWSLHFTSRTVDYESEAKSEELFKNANLNLAYKMNAKVSVNGVLGYEENEYVRSLQTEKPESGYWSLGFGWAPSPRSHIGLSGGRRYFGTDWHFSISQRGRRSTVTASYARNISSQRQYVAEQVSPLSYEVEYFPYDEVYLTRTANIAVEYNARRSSISVSFRKERREYQESLRNQDLLSRRLGWSWQMSPRSNLLLDVVSSDNQAQGQYHVKTTSYSVGVSNQLGRAVNSSFELRRTNYDSGPVIKSSENQATIHLGVKF